MEGPEHNSPEQPDSSTLQKTTRKRSRWLRFALSALAVVVGVIIGGLVLIKVVSIKSGAGEQILSVRVDTNMVASSC